MLSTPWIAPVGSPAALRRSGNAWKARYRYDDPSTSSSVFSKGTYERQDSEIFRHRLAGGERGGRGLASVPHYVRIRRGYRANGRHPSGSERVRQRARSGRPSVLCACREDIAAAFRRRILRGFWRRPRNHGSLQPRGPLRALPRGGSQHRAAARAVRQYLPGHIPAVPAFFRAQGDVRRMRERLVGEKMINREDMELVQVIDEPEGVVEAIFKHYEHRSFQPRAAEREILLNL